jgi:hypothetical protein
MHGQRARKHITAASHNYLPEINPSSFITDDRNRTIWKINNGYYSV